MKEPQDCQNIEEIRMAIDLIDREMVRLIARRGEYVAAATKFKSSPEAVRDEKRVERVLAVKRKIAEEMEADPDLVEGVFKKMISLFIKKEMKLWKESR